MVHLIQVVMNNNLTFPISTYSKKPGPAGYFEDAVLVGLRVNTTLHNYVKQDSQLQQNKIQGLRTTLYSINQAKKLFFKHYAISSVLPTGKLLNILYIGTVYFHHQTVPFFQSGYKHLGQHGQTGVPTVRTSYR